MFLICVSLIISEVENLLWIVAICVSSFEKCLFMSFAYFFPNKFFVFFSQIYRIFLDILNANPLLVTNVQINVFFCSVACLFIPFMVLFFSFMVSLNEE